MLKNTTIIFCCATIFLISSCSDDQGLLKDVVNSKVEKSKDIQIVKLSDFATLRSSSGDKDDEFILKFKDTETYNKTVLELDENTRENIILATDTENQFKSLKDIYEEAMNEADSLDFTEQEYIYFKNKYEKYLFFPEYKDDFGAYMPADDDLSKIVSPGGHIVIGNDLITIKRINSYEELQDLGKTYYSKKEEELIILRSSGSLKTHNVKGFSSFWKSEEYDSGWRKGGKGKKMRVKFGRKDHHGKFKWHSEVSFRKKAAFGKWYNYSSQTSLSAVITYENRATQDFNYSHKGSSSHDGYAPTAFLYGGPASSIFDSDFNKTIIQGVDRFYFPQFNVKIKVSFRGFYQTENYEYSRDAILGYVPVNSVVNVNELKTIPFYNYKF